MLLLVGVDSRATARPAFMLPHHTFSQSRLVHFSWSLSYHSGFVLPFVPLFHYMVTQLLKQTVNPLMNTDYMLYAMLWSIYL